MSTKSNNGGITGPSTGTIVWGLIATAVGLLVLLSVLWDISFDVGHVLIALLIGSGIALVAGGIWSVLRNKDNSAGADNK